MSEDSVKVKGAIWFNFAALPSTADYEKSHHIDVDIFIDDEDSLCFALDKCLGKRRHAVLEIDSVSAKELYKLLKEKFED